MSSSETAPAQRISQRPAGIRSFIVISLALHIPLFVYPVLRLSDWLNFGALWTLLILIPVVSSQIVSRWLLRDAKTRWKRALRHMADFLLGMSPLILMSLLIAEVIVLAGLMTGYSAAILVLLVSGCVSILGLVLAVSPGVKEVSFEAAGLREPLRFVQITDVHIGSRSSQFLENVIQKVRRLDPEFLCITGDFVDAHAVSEQELSALRRLECPIYFCIGNHERYEDLDDILKRLGNLGVKVLRSEWLYHRSDVQVLGIDDREDALQVERELTKMTVDQEAFSLLMYHRPRGLTAAARAGVDLIISGHTHNGQIFPFNLIVGRYFDRIVGLYQEGSARQYVSQGTGTWGPVMRIGTRSEITLFNIAVTSTK
jgi:predicted MPP superfamily phosphohydrolase